MPTGDYNYMSNINNQASNAQNNMNPFNPITINPIAPYPNNPIVMGTSLNPVINPVYNGIKQKRTRKVRVPKVQKILPVLPQYSKSDINMCTQKIHINILTSIMIDYYFPKKRYNGFAEKHKNGLYAANIDVNNTAYLSKLSVIQSQIESNKKSYKSYEDGTYKYQDYWQSRAWRYSSYLMGTEPPQKEDIKYLISRRRPTRNELAGVGGSFAYVNIPFIGGIVFNSSHKKIPMFTTSDAEYKNLIDRVKEAYEVQTFVSKDKVTVELVATMPGFNSSYFEINGGTEIIPYATAKAFLLAVATIQK